MAKYIDRESLIAKMRAMPIPKQAGSGYTWLDNCAAGINSAIREVKSFPASDVAPVRHGRWTYDPDSGDGFAHHMCTACKTNAIFDYTYEDDYDEWLDGEWRYVGQREAGILEHLTGFCPNCGAKMDLEAQHD